MVVVVAPRVVVGIIRANIIARVVEVIEAAAKREVALRVTKERAADAAWAALKRALGARKLQDWARKIAVGVELHDHCARGAVRNPRHLKLVCARADGKSNRRSDKTAALACNDFHGSASGRFNKLHHHACLEARTHVVLRDGIASKRDSTHRGVTTARGNAALEITREVHGEAVVPVSLPFGQVRGATSPTATAINRDLARTLRDSHFVPRAS